MLNTGKKFRIQKWSNLGMASLVFVFCLTSFAFSQIRFPGVTNSPSVPSTNATSESFYSDPTQTRSTSSGYGMLLLRTIFILVLFFAAAALIYRFLKNRQPTATQAAGPVAIVHDLPLNITKSLKVIKVVNDYYLIGVTQDQINLITKIEDKEAIQTFDLEQAKAVPQKGGFGEVLEKYIPGAGDLFKRSPLDITKGLKDRIKGMK